MPRWPFVSLVDERPPPLGPCLVCRDPVLPDEEHVVLRSAVAHSSCALYRPQGIGA
jgi:hypothetical protein